MSDPLLLDEALLTILAEVKKGLSFRQALEELKQAIEFHGPTGTTGEPSERAGVIAGLDALTAEDRHGGAVGETCRKAAALLRAVAAGATPASPAGREAADEEVARLRKALSEIKELARQGLSHNSERALRVWEIALFALPQDPAALAAEDEPNLTPREAAIKLLDKVDAWLLSVDAERGLTNELTAISRAANELREALTRPPLQTPEQAERERQSHNLGINLG